MGCGRTYPPLVRPAHCVDGDWRRTDAARLLKWAQADAAGLCPFNNPVSNGHGGPSPKIRLYAVRFALPTGTTCDRPSATARARAS
eukprot:4693845-Prymnesium_polylepis.1